MTLTFASAELVAMGILTPLGVDVFQSLPNTLTPPCIRVKRVPGEPRSMFDDPAHVEVLTFGETFETAQALAEQVADTIRFAYAKPAALPGGGSICVDHTAAILPPTEIPWWGNTNVRVFQATYVIVTRAQPA